MLYKYYNSDCREVGELSFIEVMHYYVKIFEFIQMKIESNVPPTG